jgi:hypothetical protein
MNPEAPSPAELGLEANTAARRYAARIYVAGALWLVSVAGIVAAAAGVRWAPWIAFPSAVLAAAIGSVGRRTVLDRLMASEGRHALPVVADHIVALMAANRHRAFATLRRLLPTMLEPDAPTLTRSQWNGLAWVLGTADVERSADLLVVLIQVMGDRAPTHFASAIARHADGPAPTEAEQRVRAAARQAMEAISERARIEREAATLLRPAGPDPEPGRVLLRPAHPTTPSDVGALVRPADPDARGRE